MAKQARNIAPITMQRSFTNDFAFQFINPAADGMTFTVKREFGALGWRWAGVWRNKEQKFTSVASFRMSAKAPIHGSVSVG